MQCPNPRCDAIMLVTQYRQLEKFRYHMVEVCSVCRVIRSSVMWFVYQWQE